MQNIFSPSEDLLQVGWNGKPVSGVSEVMAGLPAGCEISAHRGYPSVSGLIMTPSPPLD